jgi:hypothetical protein
MARGNPRTLAFLVPVVLLAFGAGLEAMARAAGRLRRTPGRAAAATASAAAGWLALGLVLAGLTAAAVGGGLRELLERRPEEDVERAVAFLARETRAEDLLYVHSSMREGFRLYARRAPPASSGVVLGEVDWPCCPRGRPYRRDEDLARELPGEIARLAAAGARGRRLWVLVTDREAHFRQRGRRSPALLERALAELGCERAASAVFDGARVERYECAPGGGV